MDATKIGRAIRQAREDAGLTQDELAKRIGTHQPNVSMWEAGMRRPEIESIFAVAEALGLSVMCTPDAVRFLSAAEVHLPPEGDDSPDRRGANRRQPNRRKPGGS